MTVKENVFDDNLRSIALAYDAYTMPRVQILVFTWKFVYIFILLTSYPTSGGTMYIPVVSNLNLLMSKGCVWHFAIDI